MFINSYCQKKLTKKKKSKRKEKKIQLSPVKAGFLLVKCSAGFHAPYDGVLR